MFTSRAEFRLSFNHGSSELRMLQHAYNFNLLPVNRLNKIRTKKATIDNWVSKLESNENGGISWGSRVRRGEAIATLPAEFLAESEPVRLEVLYRINYRGYLDRELRQIEKLRHVERIHIPADIDYMSVRGLRRESAIKLQQMRPFTLGQASRISGVNPADISILMVVIQAGREAPTTSNQEHPMT
jgi:tRNA uridine 5-carboxymethylaminomethyl modification enzyme